ncbi:MAG: glycosyltransferase [Clostridiales bacterium]|jgi:glycosyltransferase involved in cell wall biosynthesis|nr:glycosyltransferase [Clostridiales bacterium]
MKIIQIISDTNIGGAGKYLLAFLDNCDKSSFDTEVILPRGSRLARELKLRGVKFTETLYIGDKSFDYRAVSVLKELFTEARPDIVHTHAVMSARLAARLFTKAKIVYTRHSVFDPPKRLTIFPAKQINGLLNGFFCDKIVAVSPAAAKNLTDVGVSPKKIEVIYNGVARLPSLSSKETAKIRESHGLSTGDFVCSIVARLVDIKGHEYVLSAARLLIEKAPDVKFLIVGTGPLLKEIKEQAAELKNVVVAGFIKEIDEIMNITDVQLNASYGTEATSLSLLEGMSIGKPAVATDFGGNPYVIRDGENGLIIPQKDAEAMAEAILRLRRDRELYEKMSKRANDIYLEDFTARKMTRKICELYESLAGNAGER